MEYHQKQLMTSLLGWGGQIKLSNASKKLRMDRKAFLGAKKHALELCLPN